MDTAVKAALVLVRFMVLVTDVDVFSHIFCFVMTRTNCFIVQMRQSEKKTSAY